MVELQLLELKARNLRHNGLPRTEQMKSSGCPHPPTLHTFSVLGCNGTLFLMPCNFEVLILDLTYVFYASLVFLGLSQRHKFQEQWH